MADNTTNGPGKPRLLPARPPALEGDGGYLPRLPLRHLALAAALIALVLLGYGHRQNQKAAELRARIRQHYQADLAAPRASLLATRQTLERLIASAAKSGNETYVAPGFSLGDLRAGSGLYLRLPAQSASDPLQLQAAAKQMEPDWIPSCLGLSPTTAREIYEIGEFLTPEFVAHLEDESVLKLRVRLDTIERRAQSDLPQLLAAADARWFMLVLQEGPSRHDQPVRVSIWDLPAHKLLFAARTQAQGILLTSHILSQGVDPKTQPKLGDRSRAAANDCSIAASVKRLSQPH